MHQAMGKKDLDREVLYDLVLRKHKMNALPDLSGPRNLTVGYIQNISLFPFAVTMFQEKQLKILQRLLKYDRNICLHIDSTGSISNKLPEYIDSKRQFYYAVTVTLSSEEAPVIPLLEFITNSHTAVSISTQLHLFFDRYNYTKATRIMITIYS